MAAEPGTYRAHRRNPLQTAGLAIAGALVAWTVMHISVIDRAGVADECIDAEFAGRYGEMCPAFLLRTGDQTQFAPGDLSGTAFVLLFTKPGCSATQEVYEDARLAAQHIPVIVVATTSGEIVKGETVDAGLQVPVATDSLGAAKRALGVAGYPTAFLIGPGGTILKASSGNVGARAVLRRAAGMDSDT
jgi:peroxiredoxin